MNVKTSENDESVDPLANCVAVRTKTLRTIGAAVPDLFVRYEPRSAPVLYCAAGTRPDLSRLAELDERGVENLYIRASDFCDFSDGLLKSLETTFQQQSMQPSEKFAVMQLAVAVTMDQTLRLVECSKYRSVADDIGKKIVGLVVDGEVLPRELFEIARHDFNTFTHVTNVASYSVLLAEQLGINDQNDLQKIASAAILHDVGKRFIPANILTKAGRLTREERAIIQEHPRRGYVELCDQPNLDFGQLMMVYQHHERVDGTGYPVGVPQSEIHLWARMLAVVDVFDAMTARRPYRRPATPEHVLDYQRQLAGAHFDHEVVECWVSAMNKT